MLVSDLAQEIWRNYQGGAISNNSGYTLIDFEEATQQAAAFVIKREVWDNYKITGVVEIDENYLEVYEVNEVEFTKVNDTYSIKIPADIISLPKGYGISYVGDSYDFSNGYTRLTVGTAGLYTNLPSDIVSYIVTENDIRFINFDPSVKNLIVGLLPAKPISVNNDDAVEVRDIVLKQFGMTKQVQDQVNDQSPISN